MTARERADLFKAYVGDFHISRYEMFKIELIREFKRAERQGFLRGTARGYENK